MLVVAVSAGQVAAPAKVHQASVFQNAPENLDLKLTSLILIRNESIKEHLNMRRGYATSQSSSKKRGDHTLSSPATACPESMTEEDKINRSLVSCR